MDPHLTAHRPEWSNQPFPKALREDRIVKTWWKFKSIKKVTTSVTSSHFTIHVPKGAGQSCGTKAENGMKSEGEGCKSQRRF